MIRRLPKHWWLLRQPRPLEAQGSKVDEAIKKAEADADASIKKVADETQQALKETEDAKQEAVNVQKKAQADIIETEVKVAKEVETVKAKVKADTKAKVIAETKAKVQTKVQSTTAKYQEMSAKLKIARDAIEKLVDSQKEITEKATDIKLGAARLAVELPVAQQVAQQ